MFFYENEIQLYDNQLNNELNNKLKLLKIGDKWNMSIFRRK